MKTGPETKITIWRNMPVKIETTLGEVAPKELVDWALLDSPNRAQMAARELADRIMLLDYLSMPQAAERKKPIEKQYKRIATLARRYDDWEKLEEAMK